MVRKTITVIVAVVIAAFGAGLVFLYVQGVDQRAQADVEPVQVLTAVGQIETGESVEDAQAAGKLQLSEVPGTAVIPGALTSTDSIKDAVALAPIYEGEQIIASRFGANGSSSRISIPDDEIAISVQMGDPQRVAGFVEPGSEVAVFATTGLACATSTVDGTSTTSNTRVLLPRVTVIGVGQSGLSAASADPADAAAVTESVPTQILTLALDQRDSERVILASQISCLSMGLLSEDSRVTQTQGTSSSGLFTSTPSND